MVAHLCQMVYILAVIYNTLQDCPKEFSSKGIRAIWHQTPSPAEDIESDPQCYYNDTLITRNCFDSAWTPSLEKMAPCSKVMERADATPCPPGYNTITEKGNNYCYQLGEQTPWNHPCKVNGVSSVITDLSPIELIHLLDSLKAANISRYFWLPAHKQNFFSPIEWRIPGPNWGKVVTPNEQLRLEEHFFMNCLLLDIDKGRLITDFCTKSHPTFCFYANNLHSHVECPVGYHSFRFGSKNGACYGIAKSDTSEGIRFNDFLHQKCNRPMSDIKHLNRFIFQKLAEINELPNDLWCWFKTHQSKPMLEGIINSAGVLGLMNPNMSLTCMACETEVIYNETEFMFEYDYEDNVIYLTIYYPSGLWKYNDKHKGIQCFSDATGFVRVVNVKDTPIINIKPVQQDAELDQVEKIVYVIELVSNNSAQYWCEGHTVNFSLIATDKIIVNPRGNQIHVFSLVIKVYISPEEMKNKTDLSDLVANITEIYSSKQVLVMDILDYNENHDMLILLHLHIAIRNIHDSVTRNIQETFDNLTKISETKLIDYNYTFVNLSSSIYCLQTSSVHDVKLDWAITHIGHIAAPKQFCLQSNGLPVKRHCEGSYKFGGIWGEVEGHCDNNYKPTSTTTLLYSFIKWPEYWPISQFLTQDLGFVLGDPDIIIPADIYYLSMSLQHISDTAQENITSLDTTDIEDLAWIMDRVMILDCEYLRLAQTLNSTNVIVDSISAIIEIIAKKNLNESTEISNVAYELVVKPQFIVQITYPESNNITGIAIVNNTGSAHFTDTLIYPLYKNTTLEDVLAIKNLEIATWIPKKMLDSIHVHNNSDNTEDRIYNFHVIITLYHNDAVFQDFQNSYVLNSRIVGISIPGYLSNLEYPIPILFKQNSNITDSFCGYWDFESQRLVHIPGSWKKQGCYLVKLSNDLTVCECYHLTHFGQLVFNHALEDNPTLNKGHSVALNIITLVGSFLSLFGIIGIWITALIFGNWRKKAGTKVLLQLSTAIALPLIFIITFNLNDSMFIRMNENYSIAENKSTPCIILGALLHYSILASFMWMLITAVLQFIRYVRVLGVLRPSRFMFKFTLIGWGTPLLPVIITLALDPQNYIPAPTTFRNICYPSGIYLLAATMVPICIILVINIALFLLVLYAISIRSNGKTKTTDMDLVGAQLRVSIFLFFLLGLTWVFGIFSFSKNLIWSYLFCVTSTLQGFVLFIYFVICDPATRGLWVTLMTPHFTPNSSRNSITSISTG